MTKNSLKPHFLYRIFGVSLLISLVLSSCKRTIPEAPNESIVANYTFPYEITSVDIADDSLLLLGTGGNSFIEYNPANGNSVSHQLPSWCEATSTYYVNKHDSATYLVSRRDNGIVVVKTDDKSRLLLHPFKNEHYSSYDINFVSDKPEILIATTNGLLRTHVDSLAGSATVVLDSTPVYDIYKGQLVIRSIKGDKAENIKVYTDDLCYGDIYTGKISSDSVRVNGYYKCVNDSVYCYENGEISFASDTSKRYDIGLDKSYGSNLAIYDDSEIFYIHNRKLCSVNIALMKQLGGTSYYALDIAAQGKDHDYFFTSTGIYGMTDKTCTPTFMHDYDAPHIVGAVTHNDDVFYITDDNLYKLRPRSDSYPFDLYPEDCKLEKGDKQNKLTCISQNDSMICVGSREELYTLGADKKIKKIHTLKDDNTQENPYYTSIDYPFAGTLHRGVYYITDGTSRCVNGAHAMGKNIKQVIYCDKSKKLFCRLTDKILSYNTDLLIVGKSDTLPEPDTVFEGRETALLDIAIAGNTLVFLTKDSVYYSDLDGRFVKDPVKNPFYSNVISHGDSAVLYNRYSIVDGKPLVYNAINWNSLLLVIAIIAVTLILGSILAWYMIKLKNTLKDLDYAKAKKIIYDVTGDKAYKAFASDTCPEGNKGALRCEFLSICTAALDIVETDREKVKDLAKRLVELSDKILKGMQGLKTDYCKIVAKCNEHNVKIDNLESLLRQIDNVLKSIDTDALPKKDEERVGLTIETIQRFEKLYESVDKSIMRDSLDKAYKTLLNKVRKELGRRVDSYTDEVVESNEYTKWENKVSALQPVLERIYTGRNNTSIGNRYYCEGFIILLFTDDNKDTREYLDWKLKVNAYLSKTSYTKSAYGYLTTNKESNVMVTFLKNAVSAEAVTEHIPAKIFDLVYIADGRYFDNYPQKLEHFLNEPGKKE